MIDNANKGREADDALDLELLRLAVRIAVIRSSVGGPARGTIDSRLWSLVGEFTEGLENQNVGYLAHLAAKGWLQLPLS